MLHSTLTEKVFTAELTQDLSDKLLFVSQVMIAVKDPNTINGGSKKEWKCPNPKCQLLNLVFPDHVALRQHILETHKIGKLSLSQVSALLHKDKLFNSCNHHLFSNHYIFVIVINTDTNNIFLSVSGGLLAVARC